MANGPNRPYDRFAPFYDRYWGDFFLKDAQPGIERFFLPRVRPGGRILDLCCGTGRMARWLAGCGFQVVGLDSSLEMLRLAQVNAPAAEFCCADAQSFCCGEAFDAAISAFDSINHLPRLEDLERTFRNVRRALRPTGVFFFDVNTDEGFRFAADELYAAVEDERVCVAQSRYDPESGQGVSKVTMFLKKGELWKRSDAEITEYVYERREIRDALRAAGFRSCQLYDAESDLLMPRGEGRQFYLAAA